MVRPNVEGGLLLKELLRRLVFSVKEEKKVSLSPTNEHADIDITHAALLLVLGQTTFFSLCQMRKTVKEKCFAKFYMKDTGTLFE